MVAPFTPIPPRGPRLLPRRGRCRKWRPCPVALVLAWWRSVTCRRPIRRSQCQCKALSRRQAISARIHRCRCRGTSRQWALPMAARCLARPPASPRSRWWRAWCRPHGLEGHVKEHHRRCLHRATRRRSRLSCRRCFRGCRRIPTGQAWRHLLGRPCPARRTPQRRLPRVPRLPAHQSSFPQAFGPLQQHRHLVTQACGPHRQHRLQATQAMRSPCRRQPQTCTIIFVTRSSTISVTITWSATSSCGVRWVTMATSR
mmetsp:Transcript_111960/g.316477  ORF Transcript_111960/g.316477 Transcript_111960/m.316477 type:complete len:257 (+) Transcript_111960:680-1450(+)